MSTPLSQIRTLSNEQAPIKNEDLDNNENNLVSEILKEIENNESKSGMSDTSDNLEQPSIDMNAIQPNSIDTNPIEPTHMEMNPMDMNMNPMGMNPNAQMNMYNQMGQPNQMMGQPNQMMNQTNQMMGQPSQMMEQPTQLNNTNIFDKIINEFKQPLIVAMIFVLLSIPQINTILLGLLPQKSFIINNNSIILTIFKSMLIASLFYGINKAI